LYHGHGARQATLLEAGRLGRLLHEPLGDEGLKVDEAREFVSLLQYPPVGEHCGVVIAGPLDHALPKSTDVLLKSIEEPPLYVVPVLWATDLGGVASTIRSRCLPIWCPNVEPGTGDELVEGTARELLQAVLSGNLGQVPVLIQRVKSTPKQRGREPELIAEVVEAMTLLSSDPKVRSLWERVRELAVWRNPTPVEVLTAFLLE
jgi:DNA polymerase-3 subunit delta'